LNARQTTLLCKKIIVAKPKPEAIWQKLLWKAVLPIVMMKTPFYTED
jgi:hypothetical protein